MLDTASRARTRKEERQPGRTTCPDGGERLSEKGRGSGHDYLKPFRLGLEMGSCLDKGLF